MTDKPGWGLTCRVNEDPGISPFLADLTRQHLERYASQPRHRPFSACLTADAIDGYFSATQGLDCRREHFATTLAPLTFGRQNLKPAIFNTIRDFHHQAWWPLSEQYQVVTYGNGNVPSALTTMPVEPERSLLPFLLTYRGESQDGRFTLVTPIDVVVAESVQMSSQPDHVVRGVPLRVRLRLENRQPEAAQVRVKLAPPKHVEVTPLETDVDLPGGGSVEREITLSASSQCMLGRAWVPYTLHSTAANCRSRGSLFLWVAGSPTP